MTPATVSRSASSVTGLLTRGLLGVSHRYQVITSKALTAHNNLAGHLLALHERPLVAPVEDALWPDRAALRWHREECLLG